MRFRTSAASYHHASIIAESIVEARYRWMAALAGGPHLDELLKMGAPGLDFQTWDSVDTRLAKELGIEVSHVSESRHGAPNVLSIRIGPRKRLRVRFVAPPGLSSH